MKILKIIFACLLVPGFLVACATKDEGPEAFKNYTSRQLLTEAERELGKHNYTNAIKRLEAVDALYPFDKEAKQAQIDAIYAYYMSDDYASALAAADHYIHLYPDDEHTDYAYYMKGIVNFSKDRNWLQKVYGKHAEQLDLANMREAFVDFSDLIKLFPKSSYAPDAKKRMLYIRDLIAEREYKTAEFYFARKAYVAAANRASYIVQHLQGAPQVADAMRIMIKSYRELGADKQAEDTIKIFKLNFQKQMY